MAEFPAFPLWTDAYLADTKHLTTIEHGTYMLLLIAMWRGGGVLPNDDKRLARFAGLHANQWARVKGTIMEFMRVSDDGLTITQGRLADELQYVRDHSKRQSKNARSRWRNVQDPPTAVQQHPSDPYNSPSAKPLENQGSDDATASVWQCQTDAPTPTPTPTIIDMSETGVSDASSEPKKPRAKNAYTPEYEALWKAYPSTEGMGKMDGFKAWQKLTPEQREQVMASLPAYKACLAKDPSRPVKHVQGYLNGRMFESFGAATVTELETPTQWERRLGYARARREWSPEKWGPLPGQLGCRVPANLLQPGDGEGWREARAA